jgi:hypothetical protein
VRYVPSRREALRISEPRKPTAKAAGISDFIGIKEDLSMDFQSIWFDPSAPGVPSAPSVEATTYLINGEIRQWDGKMQEVTSPIIIKGASGRTRIGAYPMLDEATAMSAVAAAHAAYGRGMGAWPMSSVRSRIAAVEKYLAGLKAARDEIANIIMWEICKTKADSQKEVDRTIIYIQDTIQKLKELEDQQSSFTKGAIQRAFASAIYLIPYLT